MANLNGFNAADIEPAIGFEPVPSGKYEAVITDSELKPTKANTGSYLQLTFQIMAGEFKNRMIWTRLNLDNPNATAVQIARAELSAICRAVGVLSPRDSNDLHNLPLMIHVRCKKRADTDEITNEIKGFSPRETSSPPVTVNSDATPPWKRN